MRKTRFFSFYKNNTLEVSIQFEIPTRRVEVKENELDDEKHEFLKSFVTILRLFLLDIDRFSLRYLGENYFKPDQGLLFQLFPNESSIFNNLRSALNDFLNSNPQLNLS